MDLLEAQTELEEICRLSPKDKAVRAAVEELFLRAKEEGVHLRPPPWLFPDELQDFDYHHGPVSAIVPTTAMGGANPGIATGMPASGGPGRERNLLLLLHGFGGRKDSFVELAKRLQLPKTATLVLNGPEELSEELLDDPPAYSWFTMLDDDFAFIEPHPQERRRLASLEEAGNLLADVLRTLVDSCGWSPAELFLFGYGQGGTVALDLLLRPHLGPSVQGLGGVIGVATEVLPERLLLAKAITATSGRVDPKSAATPATPSPEVLLIHGEADPRIDVRAARASASHVGLILGKEHVRLRVFPKRGGEMLRGDHAEETLCFMEFLADHLHGVGKRGSDEAIRHLGAEPVLCSEVVAGDPVVEQALRLRSVSAEPVLCELD